MFMSTRYNKRSCETSTKIFSVNDSLAKLCEFLTCEFSCRKLITCKYKDFRSTKIKFEQTTRLNNAIWRAWHIQYKQKKKARFLQFAAPFSDESTHSISQAVILEGKKWKRRLDKVSREHKKWRRHLDDKLLRGGGLSKEQLEIEESESETEYEVDLHEAGPVQKDPPSNETNTSSVHDSFETLSAMYSFPDTLFSCVEKQETQKNDEDLALFKDTSGMMQPTLDHLNPCFDELMENFDFLFTDWSSNNAYQPNIDTNPPNNLLMDPYNTTQSTQPGSYLKEDQFLSNLAVKKNIDTCSQLVVPMATVDGAMPNDTIFPQHNRTRLTNQTVLKSPLSVKDMNLNTPEPEKPSSFEELPPQLQAPNLTARLQAAMSTRPKIIQRNNSDSNLSTLSQRSKKDNCPVVAKKPRIRRNISSTSLTEMNDTTAVSKQSLNKSYEESTHQPIYFISSNVNTSYTTTSILPKTMASSTNYTNTVVPLPPSNVPAAPILVAPETHRVSSNSVNIKNNQSSFRAYTPVTGLSDDFVNSFRATSHPVSTIAKIAPMPNTNQLPSSQPTVLIHPNTHRSTSSKAAFNQTDNVAHVNAHQHSSNVNESQMLALGQLLQSAPAQSAEATMCYLELLQQQLNMMMKQQQEQIQMKYQLQLQAEKILQQQQQQQNMLHQEIIVSGPSSVNVTSSQLQLVTTTSSNTSRRFNINSNNNMTQPGNAMPASVSAANHPTFSKDMWASTNTTYMNDKYPQSNPIATMSPVMKESPNKPLKMSDFMPPSSPKIYNKNKSLVSKLHRMDIPQSSEEISFYDSVRKLSQTTPPVVTQAFYPPTPTTLDSAMALVSLQHGTMTPLSHDAIGGSSTSPQGSSTRDQPATDLNIPVFERPNKFNEEIPVEMTVNSSAQSVGSNHVYPSEQGDRKVFNEHRRQCHLSAEQKRRGLIKNAFEELARILPGGNKDSRPTKLSNAAILEQTCEHIRYLQQERVSCDLRMNQLQQEIDITHTAINDCQNKLPASGVTVPRQDSDSIRKNFFILCREMIYTNTKSWIFCVIIRPLFDSFNKCVSTKTVDEFLNSLWHWLDRHCGLPVLRPVVLDTLTKLSTNTTVLDDPNCLNDLATLSLHNEDPTAISNTNIRDTSPLPSSSTFSSSAEWDHSLWQK